LLVRRKGDQKREERNSGQKKKIHAEIGENPRGEEKGSFASGNQVCEEALHP